MSIHTLEEMEKSAQIFRRYFQDKTVAVTGAAGLIGSHLLRLLEGTGCRTVACGRRSGAVRGDAADPALWRDLAAQKPDILFHLAAQTSVRIAEQDHQRDYQVNAAPMLHLIEACREKKIRPVVIFSGTVTQCGAAVELPVNEDISDRPVTVYDFHKLLAEQMLEFYARRGEIRGTCLRLPNVYGPGPLPESGDRGVLNRMIRTALGGGVLRIYGAGSQVRDYLYVEDCARALLLAAAHPEKTNGRHYVIGTGQGHTVAEAFRLVRDRVEALTGISARLETIPPPEPLTGLEERNFVADFSRFQQTTHWQPRFQLRDGIDRTIRELL